MLCNFCWVQVNTKEKLASLKFPLEIFIQSTPKTIIKANFMLKFSDQSTQQRLSQSINKNDPYKNQYYPINQLVMVSFLSSAILNYFQSSIIITVHYFLISFQLIKLLYISYVEKHLFLIGRVNGCYDSVFAYLSFEKSLWCMILAYQHAQLLPKLQYLIDLIQMEPEKLQVLPRRNSQHRSKFKNASTCNFFTNLYEVAIDQKNNVIYQFVIQTTPDIPQDSAHLYRLIFRKIRKQLKEKINDVISSGTMIWGFQNLTKPAVFQAQFTEAGQDFKFDVIVKPTKEVQVRQMIKDPIKKKSILQIFNSKVKGTVRNYMNFVELGPGKFFNPKPTQIERLGLQFRRGFKLTLCPMSNDMLMQIDVCSKISRSDNFLRELQRHNAQSANQMFQGATVLTRYGKLRSYRIEKIDYSLSPNSKFYSDKEAGQIAYADYYRSSYGIKTLNMKQPLIYALKNIDKKIEKGKVVEVPNYVYLIPQLVSLTGMSDEDRANRSAMQELAPFTKLEPKQRAQENQNFINSFNKDPDNEVVKINGQRNVNGFILNEVDIELGDGKVRTSNGSFNFKNKLKHPAVFNNWVFVYSVKGKYDDKDADSAYDLFRQSANAFGIKFEEPGFITIQGGNVEDWKKEIRNDIKKNGNPQIAVLFLNKAEEKMYGELKKFLTKETKIPSQVVRKFTLSNKIPARNMSAASKIILQMNAKVGLPLWEVPKSIQAFGKKNIMYGGISISKGANGFTLAFVGTIDKNCTKVYSEAIVGIKKKEEIPQTTFDSIFKNWAKNYYKTTKTVPELILVYREGLAEAQIQKYVQKEIRSLQKTIGVIAQKVKVENYNPKILFIGVNKKISMRFYNIVGKDQGGKFIPNLSNPDSGSVVVEELSIGNLMDFHLAAQKVTQGTCTPTQYITIYKNFQFDIENLAEFTYGQCFSYYNWTGAVRVPACLQCADKLAKLVGQAIKDSTTDIGDLENKHYFL